MKKVTLLLIASSLSLLCKAQNVYQFGSFGYTTGGSSGFVYYTGEDVAATIAATAENLSGATSIAVGPDRINPDAGSGDQVEYIVSTASISGLSSYNPFTGSATGTPTGSNVIKCIDKHGIIRTIYPVSGGSVPEGFTPGSLLADNSNFLYMTDPSENAVYRLNVVTRVLDTVLTGTFNKYSYAHCFSTGGHTIVGNALCFAPHGSIIIADYGGGTVIKYDPTSRCTGDCVSAGSNPVIIAGVTGAAGSTGTPSGDGGSALSARFAHPSSVAADATGNIFVEDWTDARIRMIRQSDNVIIPIAGCGGAGTFSPIIADPTNATTPCFYSHLSNGLAVDAAGNLFFACDLQILKVPASERNHIYRFANLGDNSGTIGGIRTATSGTTPAAAASIALVGSTGAMSGMAFDNAGRLYVANIQSYYLVFGSSYDRCPFFTGAAPSLAPICEGTTTAVSIPSSSLSANDFDANQTLTWSIGVAPHGTLRNGTITLAAGSSICSLATSGTATVPGTTLTVPSTINLSYIPAAGFIGADNFTIVVSDGTMSATLPISINVTASPIINAPSATPFSCGNTVTLTASSAAGILTGGSWAASGGYATIGASTGQLVGSGSGVEAITYTSSAAAGGCQSAPLRVNIAPPSIPASMTGSNICVGNSFVLSNPAPFGSWSASSAAVTLTPTVISGSAACYVVGASAAGAVTITYSATTPCPVPVVHTTTTTITVYELPATPAVISGAFTIATGGSTTFTDATIGGAWSSSNTALATVSPTGSVLGMAAGSAIINYTITSSHGCTSASGHIITVTAHRDAIEDSSNNSTTTSIQDHSAGIRLFPNPCTGNFTVELPSGAVKGTLSIVNMNGELVDSRYVEGAAEAVNLTGKLSSGLYMVTLSADGNWYRQQLIVR